MKPIVVSDQPHEIFKEALDVLEAAAVVKIPDTYDIEELKPLLAEADSVFTCGNTKLAGSLLAGAPKLRIIGVAGVGYDNVDVDSATRGGIMVTNVPGSNSQAVAEYALTLMLVLVKKFLPAQATMRANKWALAEEFTGIELQGRSLGLVGLGNIGRRLADMTRCIGMQVKAYDPYISRDVADNLGISLVGLREAVEDVDIVSIHTPLTAETEGLIGREEINAMKPGAYLVNTARAPVVDEDALYSALKSGHISAAATDVFPVEPPDFERPIYALENFIATPHIAAMTFEALRAMEVGAAEAIVAALCGDIPKNVVNPDVLS